MSDRVLYPRFKTHIYASKGKYDYPYHIEGDFSVEFSVNTCYIDYTKRVPPIDG